MSDKPTIVPRGRRRRQRLARARRRAARAGQGAAPVRLGKDPIAHSRQTDVASGTLLLGLTAGALATHVVFTLGVGAIATAFATERVAVGERIQVQIQSSPPALAPLPVAATEPKPETTVDVAPEAELKREPEPKPVIAKRRRRAKPVKVRPPVPAPAAVPPRRIVGADFASTVKGGGGPSIAVGNALDGHTERAATSPSEVKRHPVEALAEPSTRASPGSRNRVAAIVPTSGVKVVKPRRHRQVIPAYPPLLKAQGIEANVVVEVQIAANGLVKGVEIVAPAKQGEFNSAAKAAALREKFRPATRDGVAIAFRLTFTYRYRINS